MRPLPEQIPLADNGRCTRCGLVISAALLALVAKIYCAWTTIGSNDVALFFQFAEWIDQDGIEGAYRHGPIFNHPPLAAGFIYTIYCIARATNISFQFLFRLPSILADLAVVALLLWHRARHAPRTPQWILALFALSPVSFMVSGFHGNTDPVMTLFLFVAAMMCAGGHVVGSAIFFALALHVKVVGILLAPALFFFWLARKKAMAFAIPCGAVLLAGWLDALVHYPLLFLKNVFAYNSYWGTWGITYWLRMTNFSWFRGHSYFDLSIQQRIVVLALKVLLLSAVIALSWRCRRRGDAEIFGTLSLVWAVFFVLSPGVGPQYLVWPAPFLLLASIRWYLVVAAASSVFLFFFYNAICHGIPWHFGLSEFEWIPLWAPWGIWAWLAFAGALISLSKKLLGKDAGQEGNSAIQ